MLLIAHQQGHTVNLVSSAAVVLTGTAITSLLESDVITGLKTIIATVTDDTWGSTLGADNSVTTDFINGLDSAQIQPTGWNVQIRDNITFAAVTRTSSTIATVILPASTTYDINADETVTFTAPASALDSSASATIATPTFTITDGGNPAPGKRTLIVEPQNRTTVIEPENRTTVIEPQNRKVLH